MHKALEGLPGQKVHVALECGDRYGAALLDSNIFLLVDVSG